MMPAGFYTSAQNAVCEQSQAFNTKQILTTHMMYLYYKQNFEYD